VAEVIIANTYGLKAVSFARKNTDKTGADIICRICKMQAMSGEKAVNPVTVPLPEIQGLPDLFPACRLLKK